MTRRSLGRYPGAAGGQDALQEFPPDEGGHRIVEHPDRWGAVVDAYLARRGLPASR